MKDTTQKVQKGLGRRYRKERIFRVCGATSIAISFMFLCVLLFTIISNGLPAFKQTYIKLDLDVSAEVLDISQQDVDRLRREDPSALYDLLYSADYHKVVRNSLYDMFPEVTARKEKQDLRNVASKGAAYQLRDKVIANPDIIGTKQSFWLLARDNIDAYMKGNVDGDAIEENRILNDVQLGWIDQLLSENRLEKRFNTVLFTNGDSSDPELAGMKGAILGSFYTMLVTLLLSFPIGVAAAAYLEEFAPQNNKWVDMIEININNLAAVPSIVFGLLGLAVYINFFGVPRSTPLVGGLVLTLMTLPTIIIASRAAIKSVPPSIKEAAIGLGASPVQTMFQHTLPLAMPGILTGTIIGMAQALGETAPLLMIGMIAFVVDVPGGITDPSTVMPVQIYLWSDLPEKGFSERTSAAIMVLLGFLVLMNLIAIFLRKKFEKRW